MIILKGLPDFGETLVLEDGPVWRAFGQDNWLAPHTTLGLATSADGLPSFRLSITRPTTPFLPPAPFGVLDVGLAATRAQTDLLEALREGHPGATLAPLEALTGQLKLGSVPGAIALPGDVTGTATLVMRGDGTARFVRRLHIDSAAIMEALLQDGTLPLFVTGAIGYRGVSPRLAMTATFDPGALLDVLGARAGPDPISRDALTRTVEGVLDALPLDLSDRVGPEAGDALSQTLTDRLIARFAVPAPSDDPDTGTPRFTLPTGADAGHGRFEWDLSQPIATLRWITLATDPFTLLRDFLAQHGPDPLIQRSTLAPIPTGARRLSVLANLPTGAEQITGLHALGVTLTAPPLAPHRPRPAIVSAMLDAATDAMGLTLALSPGEPLAYRVSGFAILADAAGVRRLEGATRDCTDAVLTLTPNDFGLEMIRISGAPDLLALARITGTLDHTQDGRAFSQPIALDTASTAQTLALPLGTDATLTLAAHDQTGDSVLTLAPFAARSTRIELGQFAGYGPQRATLRCDLPTGARLAVELRAETSDQIDTLLFRDDKAERHWTYSALSPFTPGFHWRLMADEDAPPGDWHYHADARIPLILPPTPV
ncbi:hypothetical protein [Roseovarius sp. M141]|uniref:hypothetical protein n=1 Tax=Roseovarius sp. M141 TaxID=2583806 RepID=UPI0020CF0B1F|nr:hypothetical protein [Roseovarius sp. M141]MCQ0092522.1 hypothetical protein [Roseovarius sp. M141]